MKRTITLALLIFSVAMLAASCASAFDFSDIQFWTGSGSNEAALVIDWNDGKTPESIAWGYRWNGTATGYDMFQAVLADSRLYASMIYGDAVFGIGYDLADDGSGFVSGSPGDENGYAVNPSNHYEEGWYVNGYWAYWVADNTNGSFPTVTPNGSTPSPTDWSYGLGMSSRTLSNGSWDGWSFAAAPGWNPVPPNTPAAAVPVPEPGSLAAVLIAMAGMGGLALRRSCLQRRRV